VIELNRGIMEYKEEQIVKKAEQFVYDKLSNEASGHDWWHIVRVRNTASYIAKEEGANIFICELTALLHDMADEKLNDNPVQELNKIKHWLQQEGLSQEDISHIIKIIETISFKGGGHEKVATLEGCIVQDADRLDAIGAIGIARCMAYSGNKGRLIHDPNMKARENLSQEEYRNGQDTAIMHFYEKLFKLKDLMNTNYGRKIAEKRHAYMKNYLEEFYAEWDGHC
jgi:uncharacterized protein